MNKLYFGDNLDVRWEKIKGMGNDQANDEAATETAPSRV
jgi:hypothetical protein